MEFKQIQEILKFINKSDLHEVEIEQGDFKLRASRKQPENVYVSSVPAQMTAPVMQPQPQAQPVEQAAPETKAEQKAPAKEEAPAADSNLHTFKSPIIGTFYRSPSPDKEPFIKVGDQVSKGDVLCIIEAMKLFNEIECDVDGKIVKVLVENAQPVEYDTPLFLIEPS